MSEEKKTGNEGTKQTVIKIDTKNVESLIERLKEAELENRQFRAGGSGSGGMGKDEFEKTAEMEQTIKNALKEIKKEAEEEKALRQAEAEDLDVKMGKGGKGTIGLRPEDLKREQSFSEDNKTFGSHSELISHLKEQIRLGNSEAKETYKNLVAKCVKGIKEGKQLVIEDNKDPEAPSFIQHVLNERNKRLRNSKNKGE